MLSTQSALKLQTNRFFRWFFIDAGSFTGAFVGGLFTLMAGIAAWYGVQDQLKEQRLSTLISQRALAQNEISQLKKTINITFRAFGICQLIKSNFVDNKGKNATTADVFISIKRNDTEKLIYNKLKRFAEDFAVAEYIDHKYAHEISYMAEMFVYMIDFMDIDNKPKSIRALGIDDGVKRFSELLDNIENKCKDLNAETSNLNNEYYSAIDAYRRTGKQMRELR